MVMDIDQAGPMRGRGARRLDRAQGSTANEKIAPAYADVGHVTLPFSFLDASRVALESCARRIGRHCVPEHRIAQ
jgi:hypothetical protein